ncbi:MAG TPA: 6-phosphogluconolactonase [Candidatus Saccharimonadales bacterium]|nr:6-phosphogluconolactonase [Candidatus Saccharimonadales bacterium]
MEFIKVANPRTAVNTLQDRLLRELAAGKKVLWFLSGGSVIRAETAILATLRKSPGAKNLAIMLMDERYGRVGHADSNWAQLGLAGANFAGVAAIPVLMEPPRPLAQTADSYEAKVAAALAAADVSVGLFGLGEDGHTAGILPGSPATHQTDRLVVSYHTPQFDRITLTRTALQQVDAAYAFVFGPTKISALNRLRAGQEPFEQLPASLLATIPEAYIYNDQVGEPT